MLKKLQKKFILINMSLVGFVLLMVFVILVYSTYQQNTEEVETAMRQSLQMKGEDNDDYNPLPEIGRQPEHDGKEPGINDRQSSFIPTVTVIVDANGVIRIDGKQAATIDETLLDEAVAIVMAEDDETGILSDYDLRYMRSTRMNGEVRIVFADRSHELSNMQHLVVSSLLVGAASLIALFFISLGLSKWALRPVERAWEQQRQFVADASHELKTPLTVILANTGIIQSHPLDTIADQKQWIESTKEEGERMKKLIDDMLFLAKNDADRLPPVLSRVDFSDTLWSCLLPFEAVAFERGITLDAQVDPDIFVDGDNAQLKQLTLILLDNACKYSKSRSTITVSLKKDGPSASHAILSVHNLGDPISPQALPHIFERFYRADVSRVRADDARQGASPSGYGLGLAIAKTISDLHHGELNAVSTAEAGTTFTFSIPLAWELD